MTITGDQLHNIVPSLTNDRAGVLSGIINELGPLYKIDTAARLQAFIAQTAHESGNFSAKVENLNYGAPGLLGTFPKYFTSTTASLASRKPEQIANIVYANRMGNGDTASGDGWANRGGGFIQLTGKDIYTAYAEFKNRSIADVTNLVRTEDNWAMDSAMWFFAEHAKLLALADAEDIVTITKRINGGVNGLDGRKAIYERARLYIH